MEKHSLYFFNKRIRIVHFFKTNQQMFVKYCPSTGECYMNTADQLPEDLSWQNTGSWIPDKEILEVRRTADRTYGHTVNFNEMAIYGQEEEMGGGK
jgi:hypothetical protein